MRGGGHGCVCFAFGVVTAANRAFWPREQLIPGDIFCVKAAPRAQYVSDNGLHSLHVKFEVSVGLASLPKKRCTLLLTAAASNFDTFCRCAVVPR